MYRICLCGRKEQGEIWNDSCQWDKTKMEPEAGKGAVESD